MGWPSQINRRSGKRPTSLPTALFWRHLLNVVDNSSVRQVHPVTVSIGSDKDKRSELPVMGSFILVLTTVGTLERQTLTPAVIVALFFPGVWDHWANAVFILHLSYLAFFVIVCLFVFFGGDIHCGFCFLYRI